MRVVLDTNILRSASDGRVIGVKEHITEVLNKIGARSTLFLRKYLN